MGYPKSERNLKTESQPQDRETIPKWRGNHETEKQAQSREAIPRKRDNLKAEKAMPRKERQVQNGNAAQNHNLGFLRGVTMTFDELYRQAQSVLNPRQLSESASAGGVSAALLTDRGNVYLGVCIDTACSMGFCAEHAAAAAMITAGESRVVKMIAIGSEGEILPPCGRCREFISQLHDDNREAEVMVGAGTVVRLKDLLPYDWREAAR